MFDGRFRSQAEASLRPIGASIGRSGLRADHLTISGLFLAAAAGIAIGAGAFPGGLVLLILTGIVDMLDGAVAKSTGTAGPRGAFFDSVADRVSDAMLFMGVAWYLSTTDGGQIVMLPMAVMAGAMLISYERAKAESLGYDARGGVMERAERFVVLGAGLLFETLLIPVLWLMLGLIAVTAVQRFMKVWTQASTEGPKRPGARSNRRASRRANRRSSSSASARRTRMRPPSG